jgi:virginiamycin B lyase
MSGKALYRGLRDSLFCGLFIIMIGFSPLRAQITEYAVPFNGLSGIAAGPDGAMWFSGTRNIGRITTAGVVTSYPLPTSNAGSAAITAGPDGAMWFTEGPVAKIGRITISGVFTEYPLPDPVSIVTAITAGPDGALWFIESGNGKIGRITTSGTITEFPLPPSEASGGAWTITSGPDGNLWFTEYYGADKIVRMTTSGVFTEYTVANFVSSGSYGITVGPDGALWFADATFKIGRITTSGTITEYALSANDSPFGIAAGPDGALWYTDYSLGQIGRITTAGTVSSLVSTPTNTAGGFLGYIAAGPDGAMWFTETFGKIGRIPTGVTVTPPTITEVANAEGDAPIIAPNTWVSIKGSNLAQAGDSRIWQGSDFVNGQMPTQLDGVSVTVNGKPAYVYYISPTQVNILTPPDAISGSVQTQVTNNGAMSATFTAQAQAESASFFIFNGGPYITAVHLNGSLIGPATLYPGYSTPAQPGETIVIYANGFGPTSTPVVSGSSAQSGSLSPLPVIRIGGTGATVTFAGLVAPGEFQFNVVVPSSLANGDQPVTAMYNGSTTQAGTLLTVHQ